MARAYVSAMGGKYEKKDEPSRPSPTTTFILPSSNSFPSPSFRRFSTEKSTSSEIWSIPTTTGLSVEEEGASVRMW